ncbi:hypothetical protein CMEL01_02890 [Colletotrichum melonis]|uniref:Uncharacterized protein n=1 Tax=Colletotrichum melonis TaxID=1209925 RepID=A0AAI9UK80_9PEZI|nr:hypothetical protein CMEL01_02890 [Colletotrichum melonis]
MDFDTIRWRFSLRSFVTAASIAVHSSFAQECAYEGGWALRNDRSCPPSAPVECGTGAQPRCCPSGFKCTGDGDYVGNYCCEDPSDCRDLSLKYPKCPNSDWTLWGVDGKIDNGGWCCQSGQNGTYRDNSNGIALLCTPATATALASNIFWAATVYGANGGGVNELAVPEPRVEMDSAMQPTYELDAAASNTPELDAAHSGARQAQRDDLKYR